MSAIAIRADIAAQVGEVKAHLEQCVRNVVAGEQAATLIDENQRYTSPEGEVYAWEERLQRKYKVRNEWQESSRFQACSLRPLCFHKGRSPSAYGG